jgi:DNA repair photolyase
MNEFKSFFKTVGAGEGTRCYYPTRLDTYGRGCQHNCAYCYARSLLSFRGLWDSQHPAAADVAKIERVVKRLDRSKVIRLGGMTDCFMPQEKELRVTLRTLELLRKYRQPYLIVTKSSLVGAADYVAALDSELAHIQVSFSSMDEAASRTLEHASPVKDRIAALERLSGLGFDTCIRIAPLIPDSRYFNRDQARTVNRIHCDKLLVEFLRVNAWIRKWLTIDFSPFTLKEGGYNHLPLPEKLRYLTFFKGKEISVCDDVEEHYQYFKRHFNPNPDDCCNLQHAGVTTTPARRCK